MTEKRGIGMEYGQDKLKDRADNYGTATENKNKKKPKSKLKFLCALVITIIGIGALYPVAFGGHKTPAEKSDEVVVLDVNTDGVPAEESHTSIQPIVTSITPATEKAAADKAAADKVAADKATVNKVAADKATVNKVAADKAAADKVAADKATVNKVAADKASADKVAADKAAAIRETSADSEAFLLDTAAPANPSIAVTPAEEVTANAGNVSTGSPFKTYEPAKFGMDSEAKSEKSPSPTTVAAGPSKPNNDNVLKNYTGQSSEVPYYVQSQHTVYVYDRFTVKIYLLPLAKGEEINAYLSDNKGWDVRKLPGNILQVKRSSKKEDWSDATDLFLIAGKRTYTLILQAVNQPTQRTDSLHYFDPKATKK